MYNRIYQQCTSDEIDCETLGQWQNVTHERICLAFSCFSMLIVFIIPTFSNLYYPSFFNIRNIFALTICQFFASQWIKKFSEIPLYLLAQCSIYAMALKPNRWTRDRKCMFWVYEEIYTLYFELILLICYYQ